MDDVAKLHALRSWALVDDGSKAFAKPSAAQAYEQMRSYLLAQLNHGRFQGVAELAAFARNLERAIRSDIHQGADEEGGRAMLAFWVNALAFLQRAGWVFNPPAGRSSRSARVALTNGPRPSGRTPTGSFATGRQRSPAGRRWSPPPRAAPATQPYFARRSRSPGWSPAKSSTSIASGASSRWRRNRSACGRSRSG